MRGEEMILKVFFYIGVAVGTGVIAGLVGCALYFLYDWVKETIANIKWRYKYKHRFDKEPTAKCYCKDCRYYIKKYGSCCFYHSGIVVEENSFCWKAEPSEKERE